MRDDALRLMQRIFITITPSFSMPTPDAACAVPQATQMHAVLAAAADTPTIAHRIFTRTCAPRCVCMSDAPILLSELRALRRRLPEAYCAAYDAASCMHDTLLQCCTLLVHAVRCAATWHVTVPVVRYRAAALLPHDAMYALHYYA